MSARSLFAVLFAVMIASPVLAQQDQGANRDRGQDRGGDRGGDRGRGGFDPARMREFVNNRVKEETAATDEEWKVIEPKLNKVNDIRFDLMSAGRGFSRSRGGDENRGDSTSESGPVRSASRELRQVLENKDASADQIAAKLKAFREARDKAKENLTGAQKELKEVLTQRQEAVLVMNGTLD